MALHASEDTERRGGCSRTIPRRCQVFRSAGLNLPQNAELEQLVPQSKRSTTAFVSPESLRRTCTGSGRRGSARNSRGHIPINAGVSCPIASTSASHPAAALASLPSGSRPRMSVSRPSSSSVVKPCTSDQARAMSAACSSDQRLLRNSFMTSGANRAGEASERCVGRLAQSGPGHVEPFGAEHQTRTCRDGPAHRRHSLWLAPTPFPAERCRMAPAATMAVLN